MQNLYIKKRGRQGTIYLDNGVPLPIANMEDEPLGFPFTDRIENLTARFPGYNYIFVENTTEPPVSGATISDERVAQAMPEARKELGPQVLVRKDSGVLASAVAKGMQAPTIPEPSAIADVERAVCDKFRDYLKRWHYARGKEKKELSRDLEAVASFLIDVAPHLEHVLARIKDEETLEKKRMTF